MAMRNALTIDVEDYYQVSNFEKSIRREDWPNYPSRVESSTRRILRILDRENVRATFFVLGYVAERHPDLVREIGRSGHEVGSHGFWHSLVFQQTPEAFRQDLRRSRNVLEEILGRSISAYRAPSFSINARTTWALEILVEEGFTVDSSVLPVHPKRDGIPNGGRRPYLQKISTGPIWECPIAVGRVRDGMCCPISGGGYFRLFPYGLTKRLLKRVNEKHSLPFVFYTHPWEFDPDQPRLKAGSRQKRFRHYVNLRTTEAKFERLLREFSFGRLDEVLADFQRRSETPQAASITYAS